MKRKDIATDTLIIQDGDEFEYIIEDSVKDFIDDIESRVNDARDFLESIKGVDDLERVEQCLDLLKEIANDLY